MSFDFKSDVPIYLQIVENIKMQIIKKELKPLEKIPSVRELSIIYEVNPNTVLRALNLLESKGLIFTERTNGKFVTGDSEIIEKVTDKTVNNMVDNFLISMQDLGFDKNKVLEILKK